MVVLLRSKGLYRVTTGSEKEPTQNVENPKWHNHSDEALGLICLSCSHELLFHLEGIDTPHEAWDQLENLFGKTDAIRGHQLENELISLDPNNFDTIQDFISKFKSLRLQLKDCNFEKKDEQLIFTVLSKLGESYLVLVSTFYSSRDALG